jgi:hypothetical protein
VSVTYFGDNSNGTGNDYWGTGYLDSVLFQNTAGDGTLTELGINIVSGTGKVRIGVYAYDAGYPEQPGGLLLDAGELTNPSAGWNTISGLSLEVTNGTYYWLSFTDNATFYVYHNSAGATYYASKVYGALADPAEFTGGHYDGYRVCMRAGVEAGGGATNVVYMLFES